MIKIFLTLKVIMANNKSEQEPLLEDEDQKIVIGATPPKPKLFPQIFATLIACLGPLSMGMAIAFSSPTTEELHNSGILITDEDISWYGSLISVGAIAGGPTAGLLVDKLGRKTTVMMANLPLNVGWFLITSATGPVMLYCGRVLTGISVGMLSLAVPTYIAEITSKELRGTLGAGFQLFTTIGILLVYVLGIPLRWKWLSNAAACFPVLLVMGMLVLPESPRWLFSVKKRVNGLSAVRWLRGPEFDVEEECMEIEVNLQNNHEQKISIKQLFSNRALIKPLFISIGLMFFQQASGVNTIIFYTNDIFKSAGFANNTHVPTVIIGAVQVGATFCSCVLMDTAGRRVLLLISSMFMTISLGTFGLFYYLHDVKQNNSIAWLSLGSLVIFIAFFSLGWGPIPWLIMSEIFPVNARGLASSIATMFNWICVFIITWQFQNLQSVLHSYGTFWLFSGIALLSFIFVAALLPETKGKSLEEIQEYFESRMGQTL